MNTDVSTTIARRSARGRTAPHVLLVEDQLSARKMMRLVLEHGIAGLDVHEFESAEDALSWCNPSVPDVMVVDYRLPGIDGLSFIHRVRELSGEHTAPAIIVTVVDDKALHDAAAAVGVEVLIKPVKPRTFQDRVSHALLTRKAQLRAAARRK
jgi:two-component system response regulator RpfG